MEVTAKRNKRVQFKTKFDQTIEEKQTPSKEKQGWSSLATVGQQKRREKRVTFNERVQFFCYEETDEIYMEAKYNRFIKDLWRKHNEATRQIGHFSTMRDSQAPRRQKNMKLISMFQKLQHQENNITEYLAKTPAEPTPNTEEEIRLQPEDKDNELEVDTADIKSSEKSKDEENEDTGKQLEVSNPDTTPAQKLVLGATETSSTPHIMTKLEIVRRDIDTLASKAVDNRHFLATQLTNDPVKTNELLTSTSSKCLDKERKWEEIAQRVGDKRAEQMKGYIKQVIEEAETWSKERQQKINLAENLIATINREPSARIRKEMVEQRPDLSREIVLVEAAKLLAYIKVKKLQDSIYFEQWLDEQHYALTKKLSTVQARSVMEEVYNTLSTISD